MREEFMEQLIFERAEPVTKLRGEMPPIRPDGWGRIVWPVAGRATGTAFEADEGPLAETRNLEFWQAIACPCIPKWLVRLAINRWRAFLLTPARDLLAPARPARRAFAAAANS